MMHTSLKINNNFHPGVKISFLSSLIILTATPLQAVEFQSGELTGSITSTVSYGISQRIEERDPALVSGPANGGTGQSNTTDDGNLNYDDGDTFSNIVKGVHDIGLNYRNYGAFARVKWWYDFELNNSAVPHGHEPTSATPNLELDDSGFNDLAQFDGIELLDAFVFGEFNLGDKPLDVRLGKQVVNWGESTFIQGGINAINPFDVSAFRRPGAEIKEGLLPVNMLYANLGATDNLNIEAFYQLKWEKTVIDGCGTYFSLLDYAADGCDRVAFSTLVSDQLNYLGGAFVNRGQDSEADDEGQFGLSFRYYADTLDTEFGAYYINYHSRIPYVSGRKSSAATGGVGVLAGGDAVYFIEYPEDIQLYGLSFATSVGITAVSGEVSHRKDLPLQINGNEILSTALAFGIPFTGGFNPTFDALNAAWNASTFTPRWASTTSGEVVQGWDPYDVSQAQVTLVHFFERVFGASRLTLAGEIGGTYVHNLPALSEQRYGRSAIFGQGSLGVGGNDGYVTESAWGYRAVAKLDYPNAFAGVSVSPSISWKHDVDGISPTPEFQEDRQALGLGVTFSYKDTYNVGASYTSYLDDGDFDILRDRDFVSLNASVSF
jgi:hypothetical protein